MPLEGQQLGRYRLHHLLGSGGMGEVYLAMDTSLNRQVAIKVIRAQVASYPTVQAAQDAARLFQRELRAIAALDHPHILPLFDYGEESAGQSSFTYLVMPYRKEGSLTDWLHQPGRAGLLTPQDVEHVIQQAASALQHVHSQQIIHQDVKPSNFLIRSGEKQPERPDLLLADFGVAKFISATSGMSQASRGTPLYMAPEQWEGRPVPATDQYALAVMAYELLTGHPPFQGGMAQLMYQHFHVPPPPPSASHPRLPQALDAVLLRALAKHPEERFASITALADAFGQAVQSLDALTLAKFLPDQNSDLYATLAISKQEALTGSSRTLTLPGGRLVTVVIPAGAQDGQVIRVEGPSEPPERGRAGALILTLAIAATEAMAPHADRGRAQAQTLLPDVSSAVPTVGVAPPGQIPEQAGSSSPSIESRQPSVVAAPSDHPTVFPAAASSSIAQEPQRSPRGRGISRRKVLVRLGAGGIVAVSGGVTWWVLVPHVSSSDRGLTKYVYQGHKGYVITVAWSPDGKRIASGSWDTTVQVWNAADGSHVYTYKGHSDTVNAVAWSPNGEYIASGSGDKTVQVWNAADGSHIYTYKGHTYEKINPLSTGVTAVAWSPDGSRLASTALFGDYPYRDTTVHVWDLEGHDVYAYKGHRYPVTAVAWSPDGSRLASGDAEGGQIWNAADGSHIYTYKGYSHRMTAVAWSPDGKRIASGSEDKTVQVWNATDGSHVYPYNGHSEYVTAVAWSPDGKRIASSSRDKTVQVWNATDGSHAYTYKGHSESVTAVAWSPDGGLLASSSWDDTVQVWNVP